MRSLRKFFALPPGKKGLYCEAFCYVVLVRLALTFVPFRWVLAWSKRRERETPRRSVTGSKDSEAMFARVVLGISRRVPAASCLTQALALQYLLARRGLHSELRIGVRKEGRDFRAHAWLVTGEKVSIGGGSQLDSYVPILSKGRQA